MDNVFMKYMDDLVKRQDTRIKELLQDRTRMAAVVSKKEDEIADLKLENAAMQCYLVVQDDLAAELYEEIDNAQGLETTLLALVVQAAEAEDRADRLQHDCLMYKMGGSYTIKRS
jgi:hypothetical protein